MKKLPEIPLGQKPEFSYNATEMALHDQTRRAVALLIFSFFGPILTFGIVAGIVARKGSWNARLYEQAVATHTGFNLRIGSVEYRTPESVRFRNVDILDASTNIPLFHAPEVEWTFVSSKRLDDSFPGLLAKKEGERESRPSLESFISFFAAAFSIRSDKSGFYHLTIPQAEIRFETLTPEESAKKTQELLFELVSRYRKIAEHPVQVDLERVDLRLRGNGQRKTPLPDSVRFVQGNLYHTTESVRSDWTFQIPDVSELETLRFSIEERQSTKGTERTLHFSNRLEAAYPKVIPCELAGAFSSFFHPFSRDSHFFGEIKAEYRPSESGNPWTFRMTDLYLENLNLAQYAAEYTSFPIAGTIRVQILHATFGNGLFTATGWLEVCQGKMDQFLFHRLIKEFALRVEPEGILETMTAPMVPFDQCVVTFRLSGDGAMFWNDNSVPPNLFMVRKSLSPDIPGMSVFLPAEKNSISYPKVLAAFAPDGAPSIPVSAETQKILTVLPTGKTLSQPSPALPFPHTAAPH